MQEIFLCLPDYKEQNCFSNLTGYTITGSYQAIEKRRFPNNILLDLQMKSLKNCLRNLREI